MNSSFLPFRACRLRCHVSDSTQGDVCIVCRSEGTPGHGPSLAVIKYNLTLYKGWLVLLFLSQYAFTLFFTEIFFFLNIPPPVMQMM